MKKSELKLVVEEITKNEIKGMITSDKEALLKSREFKAAVKEIAAGVIEELYKVLWTRKSFWSDPIKK